MVAALNEIPLQNLALVFIPAIPVLIILYKWRMGVKKSVYALGRMLVQLLAIGYVLSYLFESQQLALVLSALVVMIVAATWISLNPLHTRTRPLYIASFVAILVGGTVTLITVTQGVLAISPWYSPRQLIPLAGMIFANAMTAISLSSERLSAELSQHTDYVKARSVAFNASLIPTLNSLFAVGLVSLPGMMTGQILSGVAPAIAVKYQIVVMVMIFSSAGLSTAIFLYLSRKHFELLSAKGSRKSDNVHRR
ncbi:MAG: putative ABC transport system permease protein [Gammaproteobacteria bacterium]|jgi:putative ABC transport system permease protein